MKKKINKKDSRNLSDVRKPRNEKDRRVYVGNKIFKYGYVRGTG